MDTVSTSKRSQIMRAVKGKNTGPERTVRSAAHALGLRFRVHQTGLPGHPDLVLPRWKTVVFVHGCFWHHHPGCKKATLPRSNRAFWKEKFKQNSLRDERTRTALMGAGWRVITLWECEVQTIDEAKCRLREFFD